MAAAETALVVDGMTEGLPYFPVAADTAANVIRHRVDTFVGLQKQWLNMAAEKTHAVAESYQEGKGFKAGENAAELARKAVEEFVETEKKFLDMAAHDVTAATKAGPEAHKPARNRSKVLTELAKEGVEKYIDAQKKLLSLAIKEFESNGEKTGEQHKVARKELRASLAELTEKSVHNLVTAQKSLMDLAIKPQKASAAEKTPKTHNARPMQRHHPVETHKAA